jgi:hypothetical protein
MVYNGSTVAPMNSYTYPDSGKAAADGDYGIFITTTRCMINMKQFFLGGTPARVSFPLPHSLAGEFEIRSEERMEDQRHGRQAHAS